MALAVRSAAEDVRSFTSRDTILLMFEGVEHTAIVSPDPERLARWYVDHLGFRINHSVGGAFFVRAADGSLIEIIQGDSPQAPQTIDDNKKAGIRHLAITVSDFDSAYEQLRTLQVNFLGEPYYFGTNRLVFFNDGDGNLLHLIRRENPLP